MMGNDLYIQNKRYDEFNTDDGPVKFSDYVNDKHDVIHQELYNEAIHEMFDDKYKEEYGTYDEFIEKNFIIEVKDNDYFKPSKIIICSKSFPYTKTTIDLNPYWNEYQYVVKYKDISELFIDEDSLRDAEIIYIDHVNGMCKMKSRLTGKEFWVSSEYVNRNSPINKEAMLRNTTFVNMLYNY